MKFIKPLSSPFSLAILLAIFLCSIDLLTKYIALTALTMHSPVYILPVLNFTLTMNTGVAFSFLHNVSYSFAIITTLTFFIMCYIVFLLRKEKSKLVLIALSFILGGAMGNFFDRIYNGAVVDFISVHWQSEFFFAIFNVADIFVNIGVYLLIIDFFYNKETNQWKTFTRRP